MGIILGVSNICDCILRRKILQVLFVVSLHSLIDFILFNGNKKNAEYLSNL